MKSYVLGADSHPAAAQPAATTGHHLMSPDVQDALQASPSVNLSEPGSSVLPEEKGGMAGGQAAAFRAGIENFAPEHTKDFCISQLREIISSLSGEKVELIQQVSKGQER